MTVNPLTRWGRRHPRLADGAFGLVAVTFSTGASLYGPTAISHTLTPTAAAFGVFSVAVITWRRKWPIWAVSVLTVATLLALMAGVPAQPAGIALMIAVWTVVVHQPRTVSIKVSAVVAGSLLGRAIVAEGWSGLSPNNLNLVILTLFSTAAGIAVRDRRAYLAALRERAERAEQTRETEAARRVAEERLRIARDLHDSLAHHMAVVNVQTGVAQHLLLIDPAAAVTALTHARTAAGQVLDELGTVLGVLRNQSEAEPTEPVPSLSRLSGLIAPVRLAGLDLRSTVMGKPRELPAAIDQAAYRLIQEALTNVQKHAPGSRAQLTITYLESALRLELLNSTSDAPPATQHNGAGFGLVGMRERCSAVGGQLQSGPVPGGDYRVLAELPIPAASAAEAGDVVKAGRAVE